MRRAWEVTKGEVPLLVTENGIGTDDDDQRIDYVRQALEGVQRASPTASTCAATRTGACSTTSSGPSATAPGSGSSSVDRATFARTPKPSARWLGGIAKANASVGSPDSSPSSLHFTFRRSSGHTGCGCMPAESSRGKWNMRDIDVVAAQLARSQHGVFKSSATDAWRRQQEGNRPSTSDSASGNASIPVCIRLPGAPSTWESRVMAACLTVDGSVASHLTAAHLWGLDGFGPLGVVDVTVPRHARPRRRPGVRYHESLAFDLRDETRRFGIPVTGTARTVLDVCAAVDDDFRALAAFDETRRRITRILGGALGVPHPPRPPRSQRHHPVPTRPRSTLGTLRSAQPVRPPRRATVDGRRTARAHPRVRGHDRGPSIPDRPRLSGPQDRHRARRSRSRDPVRRGSDPHQPARDGRLARPPVHVATAHRGPGRHGRGRLRCPPLAFWRS